MLITTAKVNKNYQTICPEGKKILSQVGDRAFNTQRNMWFYPTPLYDHLMSCPDCQQHELKRACLLPLTQEEVQLLITALEMLDESSWLMSEPSWPELSVLLAKIKTFGV